MHGRRTSQSLTLHIRSCRPNCSQKLYKLYKNNLICLSCTTNQTHADRCTQSHAHTLASKRERKRDRKSERKKKTGVAGLISRKNHTPLLSDSSEVYPLSTETSRIIRRLHHRGNDTLAIGLDHSNYHRGKLQDGGRWCWWWEP